MACKASVIIPVYNGEKTLRRCVESLVLGRERDLEVILVEDCSCDRSWEQCRSLAGEFANVTAVRNGQNRGVSYSRNRGLELARGEYVLFADCDDWVSERYAETMTALADRFPDCLCLCAHRYIDKVHNTARNYTWDGPWEETAEVSAGDFFGLWECFLLQQIWNKIFRREVIVRHRLRFDEEQSMGEDFQFVLDYMQAARSRKCVLCRRPLYYYIRRDGSSLMGGFALADRESACKRLDQLLEICGENLPKALAGHRRGMKMLKENQVYQAMRSKRLTAREKLGVIEEVMGKPEAGRCYLKSLGGIFKEESARLLRELARLPRRGADKLRRIGTRWSLLSARAALRVREVTILSQNCIGGVMYHDMGMGYASPTVGLFFSGKDFLRLAQDPERYLPLEPEMFWGETYPMGRLGDITIHFMHYETCREAKKAWCRRARRVDYGRIAVLCTDMEGFSPREFAQWKQIPYPKLLFTGNPAYAGEDGVLFYPRFRRQGRVGDLISGRQFYRKNRVIRLLNSLDEGSSGQ